MDTTTLARPPTAAPPPQPAAKPYDTFPLMEIGDDELRAVLGIAHSRAIATQEGGIDGGTVDFLNAIADTFEARGNLNPKAKKAWNDLAGAIKGVVRLVGYIDFDHRK